MSGLDRGVRGRHGCVKIGGTFNTYDMTFDDNDIWAKSARVCPRCIREDIERGTGRVEARPRLRFGWMLRTLGRCTRVFRRVCHDRRREHEGVIAARELSLDGMRGSGRAINGGHNPSRDRSVIACACRIRLPHEPLLGDLVLEVDAARNRVVVGPQELLGVDTLVGDHARWCGPAPEGVVAVGAQLRAHGEELPATAWADGDRLHVRLGRRARGVAPGQSVTVELELPVADCTIVDAAGNRVVEAGAFELLVGRSSLDGDLLRAGFTVA